MGYFKVFKGGRNPTKSRELTKVLNKLKGSMNKDQKKLLKEYLYLKKDMRYAKIK